MDTQAERNERIRAERARGATLAEIARAHGLSRSRIAAILSAGRTFWRASITYADDGHGVIVRAPETSARELADAIQSMFHHRGIAVLIDQKNDRSTKRKSKGGRGAAGQRGPEGGGRRPLVRADNGSYPQYGGGSGKRPRADRARDDRGEL